MPDIKSDGDLEKDTSFVKGKEENLKQDRESRQNTGLAGIPAYFDFSPEQKEAITLAVTNVVRWGLPLVTFSFVVYLLDIDVNYFVLYLFHN